MKRLKLRITWDEYRTIQERRMMRGVDFPPTNEDPAWKDAALIREVTGVDLHPNPYEPLVVDLECVTPAHLVTEGHVSRTFDPDGPRVSAPVAHGGASVGDGTGERLTAPITPPERAGGVR